MLSQKLNNNGEVYDAAKLENGYTHYIISSYDGRETLKVKAGEITER